MDLMKRFGAAAGLGLALLAGALPAHAATSFVQDGASMFSSGTVAQLQNTIGSFNAQTGKEIVVVTVPSLGGDTLQAAAQKVFSRTADQRRTDFHRQGRSQRHYRPRSRNRSVLPGRDDAIDPPIDGVAVQ